ncbi:MAG: phage holin family protein [Akkermansia sp.]|nr:phage holin family protein [Akkermansia sp.]
MSLFSFRKPKVITTLQEQGGDLVDDVRKAARYTASHARSLLALLKVELAEYVAQQSRRAVLFAAAGVMLLFAYALLCVWLCVVLNTWLASWAVSVAIVLLLNAVPGLILAMMALRAKPAPLAEATRRELKNDLECLRILLSNEKTKS